LNPLIDQALGAAHALLFAVFAIAGAGKLAGCRRGAAIMCRKGVADLALAAGLGLAWPAPVTALFAVAAMMLGAGGWLREKVRANPACNCFGLLSATLQPWRNHTRASRVAGGAIVLAGALLHARGSGAAIELARWQGAGVALALVLALLTFAMARRLLQAPQRRPAPPTAAPAPGPVLRLAADTPLGTRADGVPLTLGDLARPGRPIALLLGAKGCAACAPIKAELAPLLGKLPFPACLVLEDAPAAQDDGAHVAYDPHATFRRLIGGKALPALVLIDPLIDPLGWTLAAPLVSGEEAIRATLLRTVLAHLPQLPQLPHAAALSEV
jgi:hypothetical protein